MGIFVELWQKLLLTVFGGLVLLASWYLFANYLVYPFVKDSYTTKLYGLPPADMPVVVVIPAKIPPAVQCHVIKYGDVAAFARLCPAFSFRIPRGWEKISAGNIKSARVPEVLPGAWTIITSQQNFEEQLIRLSKQDDTGKEALTYEYIARRDSLNARSMAKIPQAECFSKTSLLALMLTLLIAAMLSMPGVVLLLSKSKKKVGKR